MKTSELTGVLLDCFVAKAIDPAEKIYLYYDGYGIRWHRKPKPCSTDWGHGGPIIEDNAIGFQPISDAEWMAEEHITGHTGRGATPLIAAMRAFVASKFGDEVSTDEPVATPQ